MGISTMTYDQFFITAVGISSSLMVCSAAWIVRVLIQIEKSKVVALSSVLEDDGTGSSDLQFEESTSDSGGNQLEVEADDGPSGGAIEMCPTGSSRKTQSSPKSSPKAKPMTARKARQKQRRISWTFVNIQIASVSALVLLTYLLLVQSNAAIFLRMLGSFTVFGVFLRFQIGEEVRRQRVDRIMLLLSLFLLIASMLSMLVYSMKELAQGEIYEGPARIIGYSQESYNNTKHDPTSRTDMTVAWGREWGCPWSGGKVCSASIQGAMCQTHPDTESTKHKPHYDNRRNRKRILEDGDVVDEQDKTEEEAVAVEDGLEEDLEEEEEEAEEMEDGLEEDLEDEEKSNQDLVQENEDLEDENEMLQEEIEELKEENEVEDEENDELVDQENSELDEIVDEYDEDLMIIEEEEYADEQSYVDAEYEEEEESLEEDVETATDGEQKEELTEELEEEEEDQEIVDEEYEEDEELLDEYADEYGDAADESYSDLVDEQDETYDLEDEKEELEEEVDETEAELDEIDSSGDDIYDEIAEEVYDEEEEEIEEEYEDEYYDDDWYWDEYPDYYDDDYYEDEYWDYDWDSVWGDYACEDLFDADIGGQTYDVDVPAGGDDEWPFVNVYGSCKTCEAYILDYFAEEAFEETQEYKQQAIVYMAGAMAGFVWTILSYIKYRVLPTAENEIELLGSDGGVMA